MKTSRILVAEDLGADVLLNKEALIIHGIPHELELMQDGALAMNFFANLDKSGGPPCPDVTLLDLNLPKVEGREILQAFTKHPDCQTTPVMLISSSDAPKYREKLAAVDAAQYFKKSSDFEEYMRLGQQEMARMYRLQVREMEYRN